jgi:hypothetical protein
MQRANTDLRDMGDPPLGIGVPSVFHAQAPVALKILQIPENKSQIVLAKFADYFWVWRTMVP